MRIQERDSNKEIKEIDVEIIEMIKLENNNKIQKLKVKLDAQQLEVNDIDKKYWDTD